MPKYQKTIIRDKEWKKIKVEHNHLDNLKLKIGYFGSGKPNNNIAYLAAIQTYGIPEGIRVTPKMRAFLHSIGIHLKKSTVTINMPQRPYMQNAMDDNVNKIMRFIIANYKLVLQNKLNITKFIERIALRHEDQIKNSIKRGSYEKLHPVTAARKGSSKPLIGRTGELISKVQHKVDK